MATPGFLNACIWTAVSAGTGSFVVAGAYPGYYTPAQCKGPVVVDGGTYRYFARNGLEHEEGVGVWTSATSTLTRATVLSSSNSGSLVSFTGAPTVYMGCALSDDMSPLDVFLVAGQSNAVGEGTSAQAPTVPTGKVLKYVSGVISDANEPVDPNGTGGAWASFGLTYYAATNRLIMFVPTAVGGSAQAAAADDGSGNWDASGSLWSASVTTLNAAITAATTAGYTSVFRGVLWIQGERDSGAINSSTITQATYQAALTAMIARYRAATIGGAAYPQMPFYISRTGHPDVGTSDTGYSQVRSAQEAVAAADPYTHIMFRDAYDFFALGYTATGAHYTQAGYNMLGRVSAANIIAAQAMNAFQLQDLTTNLYYTAGNVTLGWPVSSGAQFSVNTVGSTLPAPFSGVQTQLSQSAEVIGTSSPFVLVRGSLGTIASPTKITSGSGIGFYAATGYDASPAYGTKGNGALLFRASEDWNDATHHGTMAVVRVTANATDTPADSFYFNNDKTLRALGYTSGVMQTDASGNITSSLSLGAISATSLTSANVYGGSAAGSSLNLQSTSNGAPSGDGITVTAGGSVRASVLSNGNVGIGTETNPQWPFVVSQNATTGIGAITGFAGPLAVSATAGGAFGWHALGYATNSNNNLIRIDGTPASPSNLGAAEIIGNISFSGWGAGAIQGGRVRLLATTSEAWTTTFGSYLEIDTTPAGGVRAQAMRVMGGVIIGSGTTDPGAGNIILGTHTVSGLPSVTGLAGARSFVTDANATTFASIVAGGGANGVPVYCDGTNWRIG